MSADLSPRQQNICLLVWWLLWAAVIIFVVYLALLPVGAVELSITGNASGHGTHTIEVLPDLTNLTAEEATYLLGPGYGYNVSRDGLVTFENGSTWAIIRCNNTGMTEMRRQA